MSMDVSDVMTRRVITIAPNTSVAQAAQLMMNHHISGLPVVGPDGKLQGMVTEGDLLRRSEAGTDRKRPHWLALLISPGRMATEYVQAHGRKAVEIMSRNIVSVGTHTSLSSVVKLMEEHHVKRVLVVEDEKLVGIVSRADLLKSLLPTAVGPAETTDKQTRDAVLAEIDKQTWAPSTSLDATVENGVVTLRGLIFDEREREALHVLAENICGVKEVRDELVWVDPLSGMVVDSGTYNVYGGSAGR